MMRTVPATSGPSSKVSATWPRLPTPRNRGVRRGPTPENASVDGTVWRARNLSSARAPGPVVSDATAAALQRAHHQVRRHHAERDRAREIRARLEPPLLDGPADLGERGSAVAVRRERERALAP